MLFASKLEDFFLRLKFYYYSKPKKEISILATLLQAVDFLFFKGL